MLLSYPRVAHHIRPYRCVSLFLIIIMGFICPLLYRPLPAHAEEQDNTVLSQSEKQYKKAKDYYYQLERDTAINTDRQNWLTGIRNFRRIYLADSKGPLAPSCLYMMARIYQRSYQHFHLPLDIDESINYFKDVAALFPQDKLADDALYNAASIYLDDKDDADRSAEIYINIIKHFPTGDKYAQSVNRLRELARRHDISFPEQLTRSNTIHQLVNVLPIQYWSSADYTRVVIRANAPVHYNADLLEQNSDQPRRLYIDFAQSFIPTKYRAPIPIQDGLLKQVRTGQFNDSTVRVVLDIESISDYKIFSLKDPFRVVIDVHGKKKSAPAPPVENIAPQVSTQDNVKQPPREEESTTFVTLADQKKSTPDQQQVSGTDLNKSTLSLAQQLGLGIRKIVIDPGHGGKDPGALGFGLKEKDIVLTVARRMAAVLRQEHNYDVILTRSTDTSLSLEERTAIANTEQADLFISIHINAHPDESVHGIETFYLNLATNTEAMRVAALENATSSHNISELQDILSDLMKNSKIQESSQLAEVVQARLVSGLMQENYRAKDLGVKQAPFYVLIGAEMPAILSEISFITNPQDAHLLRQQSYLHGIAAQLAEGIISYVGQRTTAANYR